MANKVQKISIALPTEMVDHIRAAVDSGQYASTSEVVREAVREWRGPKRSDFPPGYPYVESLEQLRGMVREAIESLDRGEGIPGEIVHADLLARFGKPVPKKTKRK